MPRHPEHMLVGGPARTPGPLEVGQAIQEDGGPGSSPFLRQPGLDATNWRAELAIRFGVILRKVWGGSRTWAGARAQAVLMSVWRTCWQQGGSALDFLSLLLRGTPAVLALPP